VTEFYTFHKVIGYGNFGVVREAERNGLKNSKRYAVKSINKDTLKTKLNKVRQELELLMTVDHPNLIKIYEMFEDLKYVHIVMDL
jgi:calcium-dependent protein kinase